MFIISDSSLLKIRAQLFAALVLLNFVYGLFYHELSLIVGLRVDDVFPESFDELKRELLESGSSDPVAIFPPLPLLIYVGLPDIPWYQSPSIDLSSGVQAIEYDLQFESSPIDAVVVDHSQGEET